MRRAADDVSGGASAAGAGRVEIQPSAQASFAIASPVGAPAARPRQLHSGSAAWTGTRCARAAAGGRAKASSRASRAEERVASSGIRPLRLLTISSKRMSEV